DPGRLRDGLGRLPRRRQIAGRPHQGRAGIWREDPSRQLRDQLRMRRGGGLASRALDLGLLRSMDRSRARGALQQSLRAGRAHRAGGRACVAVAGVAGGGGNVRHRCHYAPPCPSDECVALGHWSVDRWRCRTSSRAIRTLRGTFLASGQNPARQFLSVKNRRGIEMRVGLASLAVVVGLGMSPVAFADTAQDMGAGAMNRGGPFSFQGGQAIFTGVCQGCHMPDAKGAVGAGMYPALSKDEKLETAGYPVAVVTHGQKAMPRFGALLNDQQIADVVNYVRSNFGNKYKDKVKPEDVKAQRPESSFEQE